MTNTKVDLKFFTNALGETLYIKHLLRQIPIRTIDFSNSDDKAAHARMVEMVEGMLELHKQKAAASGDALDTLEARIAEQDAAIDALVYELYDLDEEEIAIVEASVAG